MVEGALVICWPKRELLSWDRVSLRTPTTEAVHYHRLSFRVPCGPQGPRPNAKAMGVQLCKHRQQGLIVCLAVLTLLSLYVLLLLLSRVRPGDPEFRIPRMCRMQKMHHEM